MNKRNIYTVMLMQYFKIKKATARYKHYNVLVIRDGQNILLDCTQASTNVPFLELIFNKQLCFTLFNLIGFDPPVLQMSDSGF